MCDYCNELLDLLPHKYFISHFYSNYFQGQKAVSIFMFFYSFVEKKDLFLAFANLEKVFQRSLGTLSGVRVGL